MNALKEILDRVAELNVMFLAIDGKEATGEKMGGIAWQGPKDRIAVWLALNMQINPDVKDIILNATNIFLNRWKENRKAEEDLGIYNLKFHNTGEE